MSSEQNELPRGRHLKYALSRRTSSRFQIGCTFAIAVVLGGLAYLAYANVAKVQMLIVFAVVLGLIALLLLYSAIHQLFALRTRQTIVEIAATVLTRGEQVRFWFQQPGPADFESLRANLVGEGSWSHGTGKSRTRSVESLGMFNFFDSGEIRVDEASRFECDAVLNVPGDIIPTGLYGDNRVASWNIEVWGKVKGRADFQHVFPIHVS